MITDFFIRQWLAFSKWKKTMTEKAILFIAVWLDMLFMGRLRPLWVILPLLVVGTVALVVTYPKWVPDLNALRLSLSQPTSVAVAPSCAPTPIHVGIKDHGQDSVMSLAVFDPLHAGSAKATSYDFGSPYFPIAAKDPAPAVKKKPIYKKKAVAKPKVVRSQFVKKHRVAVKPKVVTPSEPTVDPSAVGVVLPPDHDRIALIWTAWRQTSKDEKRCLVD